ncbi:hypothetical protein SAMN04487851_11429 [Prevotella sp. tc2-28]|uniref:hypothetical protein n=1 Tax=Prevotella sp. tc2-28 TaxID=1761888 RepID=UPI000897D083|nr:hypothetical protein [Prevotella sp. tc2-28]SEA78948.1 hypothetical protein SAMN04487851_11429 [Prevotella sp. tc2-28]
MNNKKLKDLRKDDRIWYWHFTCTTPIYVESIKREGDLMRIKVKWDEAEFECFGHALGVTCVGHNRKLREDIMFTCSYDISKNNEEKRQKIKALLPVLSDLTKRIEKL